MEFMLTTLWAYNTSGYRHLLCKRCILLKMHMEFATSFEKKSKPVSLCLHNTPISKDDAHFNKLNTHLIKACIFE